MESHPSVTDRPVRIPPIAWFLGVGLIVALVAIFFFNVAINTIAYYGFLALMIGSHFFMHGGHGDHAGHSPQSQRDGQSDSPQNPRDSGSDNPQGHVH